MSEQLHFRISAALKDIIGKDLITDDYVAVFELVKNSYDAYATQVDIYFENSLLDNFKPFFQKNCNVDLKDKIHEKDFVIYKPMRQNPK